jgi:hypothetical protein
MNLLSQQKAHEQVADALAESLGDAYLYAGHSLEAAGANLRQDDFWLAGESGSAMDTWVVAALNACLAFPQDITAEQAAMDLRQVLRPLFEGVYDCTRVWSAWWVGTMTADDFVPINTDDEGRLEQEISPALLRALTHQAQSQPLIDGALRHFRQANDWRGLEQFALDDERPERVDWLSEVQAHLPPGSF